MATQLETYLAGRDAFALLTGDIDRKALRQALRDGYAAVVMLADNGKSYADIAKMDASLSKSKVEKDVRAGRAMASHPKVSPTLIVKACNVGNASEIKTALADEKPSAALQDLVDRKNENRRKRAARPNEGHEGQEGQDGQDGQGGKGPKVPARKTGTVTFDEARKWIASQPWTADQWADIARLASKMETDKRAAEASVSKVS